MDTSPIDLIDTLGNDHWALGADWMAWIRHYREMGRSFDGAGKCGDGNPIKSAFEVWEDGRVNAKFLFRREDLRKLYPALMEL